MYPTSNRVWPSNLAKTIVPDAWNLSSSEKDWTKVIAKTDCARRLESLVLWKTGQSDITINIIILYTEHLV